MARKKFGAVINLIIKQVRVINVKQHETGLYPVTGEQELRKKKE